MLTRNQKKGLEIGRGWNKGLKGLQSWHNISGLRPHKKGKFKHSKEANEKNRLNHLGKKQSLETRIKRGLKIKGKKHWNWQGGKTSKREKLRKSLEYRLWRKSCFERDNFTCQKYGVMGGRLVVHHINNFADFPELRFAIDNGITLSDKAHREFHKIYGWNNNTKEQLEEFLS